MLVLALLVSGCLSRAERRPDCPPRPSAVTPCWPPCKRPADCAALDAQLLAAREPLLACIRERSRHGDVGGAHGCFRALRFVESARWWLRTMVAGGVYRPSLDGARLDFMCRIRRVARARTAAEIEQRYLEMVRQFP